MKVRTEKTKNVFPILLRYPDNIPGTLLFGLMLKLE